jgi:hypothetical protein
MNKLNISQIINKVKPEDGCGKYLYFTKELGDREMVLCGKRDYQYHKDLFVQCENCKNKK